MKVYRLSIGSGVGNSRYLILKDSDRYWVKKKKLIRTSLQKDFVFKSADINIHLDPNEFAISVQCENSL